MPTVISVIRFVKPYITRYLRLRVLGMRLSFNFVNVQTNLVNFTKRLNEYGDLRTVTPVPFRIHWYSIGLPSPTPTPD